MCDIIYMGDKVDNKTGDNLKVKRNILFIINIFLTFNLFSFDLIYKTVKVYRIRRTWGELDFYSMAINGYTDEGKTSGEITLPAHRQKLVEMIQELEK